jgi:hypothetical protein
MAARCPILRLSSFYCYLFKIAGKPERRTRHVAPEMKNIEADAKACVISRRRTRSRSRSIHETLRILQCRGKVAASFNPALNREEQWRRSTRIPRRLNDSSRRLASKRQTAQDVLRRRARSGAEARDGKVKRFRYVFKLADPSANFAIRERLLRNSRRR